MKKVLLFIALFAILFSINSFAGGLGLRSEHLIVGIDFEPGFDESYGYSLLIYGNEKRDVQLYVIDDKKDGTTTELAKYFTLSKDIIKDVNLRDGLNFEVRVNLPSRIDEPGLHKLHVGAVEMFGGSGGMGAKTAIEAIFFVNVLHEGQYLVYSLKSWGVNQGKPIPVELHVNNLGTEEIKSLYADVELLDFNKNAVDEKRTETINLIKRAAKTLKVEFPTSGLLPGTYAVNATIHHDGNVDYAGKEIKLGELNLRIINQTEEIAAEKINEIEVLVESQWADTLKDVYATIKIGENTVRTLPETILGFEKVRLKAFFDTKNMESGVYDMLIKVYFEDKIITKTSQIKVTKDFLRMPSFSMTNILFLTIIAIVIIINITLFIILIKKKHEHERERGI